MAQQSVTISGPTSVEVGVSYNYTFEFKPDYAGNSKNGVTPDSYIITNWIVSTGTNGSSGSISGYIGNPSNQSSYLNDATYNNSNPKTVPIQWGNGTFLSSDKVTVKLSGIYRKKSTDENTGYFTFQPQADQSVTVERIVNPAIEGNASVLNCNQTPSTYFISNTTNANSFQWQVANGAQISGSNTGTSVIVIPPLTGDFYVGCIAKRTGANPNYFVSSDKKITRSSRSIGSSTNPANQGFLCKGSGLIFQIDNQSDIESAMWNAPNCTVSPEIIVNGKRQVTISPNSSIVTGSSIAVSATINYLGGCSVTTPSKTFNVYDSGTPQTPQGTISFTSQSSDICNPGIWIVKFRPSASSPFVNGEISIDPPTIIPGKGKAGPYDFEVCYTNICSGNQTCNTITRNTPVPCITARLASSNETQKLVISPNPTNGSFEVIFPERLSGNYQIFDQNSVLIQENKFVDQSKLQIELQSRLKSGIYILKVITDDNIFTDKIILNK